MPSSPQYPETGFPRYCDGIRKRIFRAYSINTDRRLRVLESGSSGGGWSCGYLLAEGEQIYFKYTDSLIPFYLWLRLRILLGLRQIIDREAGSIP